MAALSAWSDMLLAGCIKKGLVKEASTVAAGEGVKRRPGRAKEGGRTAFPTPSDSSAKERIPSIMLNNIGTAWWKRSERRLHSFGGREKHAGHGKSVESKKKAKARGGAEEVKLLQHDLRFRVWARAFKSKFGNGTMPRKERFTTTRQTQHNQPRRNICQDAFC